MSRYVMAPTMLLALGLGLLIDRSASAQASFSCDDFSASDETLDAILEAGSDTDDATASGNDSGVDFEAQSDDDPEPAAIGSYIGTMGQSDDEPE